jgi:hypothetical protein
VTRTLSTRALNRALLGRQLLLNRTRLPAADVVQRLVGLQAQIPADPYVGLWTRIERFRADDLATLITERRAVRIALLRATVHLVTAPDALAIRPVIQPVLERNFATSSPFGKRLGSTKLEPLLALGRRLVEERPRSNAELGPLLHARWPDRDAESLAQAVRLLLPMVQVPPRGLWGQTGQARHTTLEQWLGAHVPKATPPDALVLRYLAAFGPATVADTRTWSGLAGLREAFERLRPRLRTFRDEHGRELFDVLDGPLPDEDTPAPPRFLPVYDNLVLSHADRSRVIGDAVRSQLGVRSLGSFGTVLIDGFVRAAWRIARTGATATLRIESVGAVPKREGDAVVAEGERLLAFAASDAGRRDVTFVKGA